MRKPSYKQPVKEKSRELIWKHAVETLTSRRDENRILNISYMERLWLYCQQQLKEDLDIDTFVKWKEYADICYGNKKPEDLKVAFFCGNEPENDVVHILKQGVRIENVYAFECDNSAFREAVDSLHDSYPLLKVYKGKIESYAELQNTKFDIVYLDFTGSLLKEYKTVVKLLDLNAMTDMSVLAVNSSFPDKTDDNVNFLVNYFFNDTFFEESVINGFEETRKEGDTWFYRIEDCFSYGISCLQDFVAIIDENYDYAYSAFQSSFILDYANRHKASYEVFKQQTVSRRLIKSEELVDFSKFEKKYYTILFQSYCEDGRPLDSEQYLNDGFINVKESGGRFSRLECMKISNVFFESPYSHLVEDNAIPCEFDSNIEIEEVDEQNNNTCYKSIDFKSLLTDEVKNLVENMNKWFHGKYRFCDLPMEHLWLEVLLFQFGHPYHTNTENHRRYKYKAKTRKMCVDIFTLDKCRAFYDWMPMLEYFINDMQDNNRQMIARMCIDAIGKHLLHIVDEIYYGSALVGINEFEWSKNHVLQNRMEIKS